VQILGSSVRKIIQNYDYKIGYGYEYLFIAKKKTTTNYEFKKADK
jgi:hypothetical protein